MQSFRAGELNGVAAAVPVRLKRESGTEAGCVGKQVQNGDGFFVVLGEGRQIFGDGVAHVQFSQFVQFGDGRRGGDDFGKRGEVKNGVRGHFFAMRKQGAMSVSFAIDLPFSLHPENAARNFAVGNGLADCLAGAAKFFELEELFGRGGVGNLRRRRLGWEGFASLRILQAGVSVRLTSGQAKEEQEAEKAFHCGRRFGWLVVAD